MSTLTLDRPAAAEREPLPVEQDLRDLVLRATAGEADAFGALYDHYVDLVYRYVYYRVGAHALAEDLTSETFLRALRRVGLFTWQGKDFGAWLVTIARNLVLDHFKSSRYRLEVCTPDLLDSDRLGRGPRTRRPGLPHQPRALQRRPRTGSRTAGMRRPALPPRPVGRRDRPGDGQEHRRHQGPPVPRRTLPGPNLPRRPPLVRRRGKAGVTR